MKSKICLYIFLIAIILLNLSIVYATNKNNYNINEYFRVHVVANSDSIDDQLLKYNISKKVNEYISTITKNCTSKEESKKTIENNIQEILKICQEQIDQSNAKYNVTAYIGSLQYDEKTYNNVTMDEGIYDSLKIVIGKGNGQNWWSLIYPSSISEVNIYNESDSTLSVEYSFGIIELIKQIFN